LDTDEFLSWLAVNTLLTNLDSYAAAGHNYYLYRDLRTERFIMIPWDLSHSFGGHPFFSGTPEELANFDIYHPYPEVAPKSLIVRLLEVPRYRQRYLTKLEELIAGAFRPDVMAAEIDRLYQLVHGDVTADTRKEFPTEAFEIGVVTKVERPFRPPGLPLPIQIPVRQVPGLKSFVAERVQNVRAQLAGAEGYRVQPYSPISPEQMFEMNRQRSTVIAGLPDEYPGVQLWQIREQLELTESQREQIEAILKATAEQNRSIQTQIENLQKEVYLLMAAGKGELAEKKAGSAETLHQQRVKILAPAFERIMGVLTETQRHTFIQHQHRARPDQ
ncbi:CotH kinase family protein, partial [Candidatus Poribacteria bacterium]|nr:CotH kinase family protein [Candidatus Poribacteria bacterium]